MIPCPGTVLGRAAGRREFSWQQPACFLTEPDVRSPRQSPVAVYTSCCPGQFDLKDEEQDEEMRSQDEQMSCGPDRSYDEGDETGKGELLSQRPPQSSGRGPRRQTAGLGRGRRLKITAKKAGRYDSPKTSYTTKGVAGVQPGITASRSYSCAVLLQAQNVRT